MSRQNLQYILSQPDLMDDTRREESRKLQLQVKDNKQHLLDLEIQYFSSRLSTVTSVCDRMVNDQMRFGKEEFDDSPGICGLLTG